VRGVSGPPRGTFPKHGLVVFLKNCFPGEGAKIDLDYYGGNGYGGCAEEDKYVVKFGAHDSKEFTSLSKARDFYDGLMETKSVWHKRRGELLEAHSLIEQPKAKAKYHEKIRLFGWFDLDGDNIATWEWHPVRGQYMTSLKPRDPEGYNHNLYSDTVEGLELLVNEHLARHGWKNFQTY
jgi:hypothetical protein